jgi:hypothetical protein
VKTGCYNPTSLKMNLALERNRKEIQKLCLQFFFSLPSSFFLGVVSPLHLAHPDLISGEPLGRVQNPDMILLIREIFTSTQIFHGDLIFRHM